MDPVSDRAGLRDRAEGTLLGLAAGDALGAGYEFGAAAPSRPEMVGGGLGSWEPGEWTDDTQMAICIAEVTKSGSCDPERIGQRFIDWFRAGPKDVGTQTRVVLGLASGPSELTDQAHLRFEQHPRNSAGNGSLMRTAPVALAHLGDDDALRDSAMTISNLTHGDPLTGEACVLWCVGIDRAIREERLDGIREGLDLLPAHSRTRWASWIEEAESLPAATFNPNGFVVKALQAAHAAVVQTEIPAEDPSAHLVHALYAAVGIGDDTDTVAAIAGSLLGARWGASAIPLQWQESIHGWPDYRADDLRRLAAMSVSTTPRGALTEPR